MRKKTHRIARLCGIAACLLTLSSGAPAATTVIDLDFADPAAIDQLDINGTAGLVEVNGRGRLRLTEEFGESGAVWLRRPLRLPRYLAEFDFEVARTEPNDQPADGFTFTAQEWGPVALGVGGGGLAYMGIPGYSYAVEFNTYAVQGLKDQPETVALNVVGARAKIGQTPFPHIDRGIFHTAIAVRREMIEVTISGGSENLPPTQLFTSPWWLLFDTDRPLWFGFTGATGGLRSVIDILNLKITALP
jgi:hypothetical protein